MSMSKEKSIDMYKQELLAWAEKSGQLAQKEIAAPLPDCEEPEDFSPDCKNPSAQVTVEPPASYDEFAADNTETGYLRVQVTAARQSLPVGNAQVSISKRFEDEVRIFEVLTTDISGNTTWIALPAPKESLSESPSAIQPYATYDVRVTHPAYQEANRQDVVIFPNTRSVQTINLTL